MFIHEGTNSIVHLSKDTVIKTLKTSSILNFENCIKLQNLTNEYYHNISKHIFVPKTVCEYTTEDNNRYIFRQIQIYCGDNILNLSKNKKYTQIKELKAKSLIYLQKLPENILIDAHPLNFVINKNNDVAYVDVMPPLVTLEPKDTFIKELFPIFVHKDSEQLNRRMFRYATIQGRLKKYAYYEEIIKVRLSNN